jgi:hypothetical protein
VPRRDVFCWISVKIEKSSLGIAQKTTDKTISAARHSCLAQNGFETV